MPGQCPVPGVDPAALRSMTADPRRYGFHATLKAPFRLAPGRTLASLVTALKDRFRTEHPFALPHLDARLLGSFVALVPSQAAPRIDQLAATCVCEFDAWRAPLNEAELARRLAGGLDERGRMLLSQWGYPSVLDRFRLHFSLTGTLDASGIEWAPRLIEAARERMPVSAMWADAVCVFEERAPGADLHMLERIAFEGLSDVDDRR